MLYLQDVFDDLAFSKFSNLAVGNSSVKSIDEQQYPRVVSLLNSALLSVYSRLVLIKKEFDLYQREDQEIYYLRSANVGYPDTGDPSIYIDGTGNKAINSDIIKLMEAYDSTGKEIYINNNKYPDDIFLRSYDTLKIGLRDPLEVISIVYQANHPQIIIKSDFDPKTYEVFFPRYLLQAITNHIASEWFMGKASNAVEGQPSIANTFKYAYETEMARIEALNFDMSIDEKSEQFEKNGWA